MRFGIGLEIEQTAETADVDVNVSGDDSEVRLHIGTASFAALLASIGIPDIPRATGKAYQSMLLQFEDAKAERECRRLGSLSVSASASTQPLMDAKERIRRERMYAHRTAHPSLVRENMAR